MRPQLGTMNFSSTSAVVVHWSQTGSTTATPPPPPEPPPVPPLPLPPPPVHSEASEYLQRHSLSVAQSSLPGMQPSGPSAENKSASPTPTPTAFTLLASGCFEIRSREVCIDGPPVEL